MATGSGKTFTAVNFVYRLIKHAKAQDGCSSWWTATTWAARRSRSSTSSSPRTTGASSPSCTTSSTCSPTCWMTSARCTSPPSSACTRCCRGEAEFDPANEETRCGKRTSALAGQRREGSALQPAPPDRVLRFHHHRRVPPLDLQPVAAGAGVFRCLPDRPDRHAQQADLRLLQPEPGDGVLAPARRGGWGQRGRRGLPHPHADHRAGQHHREGLVGGQARQAHPPPALGAARRGFLLRPERAGPRGA